MPVGINRYHGCCVDRYFRSSSPPPGDVISTPAVVAWLDWEKPTAARGLLPSAIDVAYASG